MELLKKGLNELVSPFLIWDGPHAMETLWFTTASAGGVMAARRAREDPALARVKGHSEREELEGDDEEGCQADALQGRSSAWWMDGVSGCPSVLEETVMGLLDSGFTPQGCPVLREKLHAVVKAAIKHYTRTYRLVVPMSVTAFLVPGSY